MSAESAQMAYEARNSRKNTGTAKAKATLKALFAMKPKDLTCGRRPKRNSHARFKTVMVPKFSKDAKRPSLKLGEE